MWMRKKRISQVLQILCRDFMWKRCLENIDTDINCFVQYSDHNKNSSKNENEACDTNSDSNSDDELSEPYISDENDPHMNERGKHTNNEDNNIHGYDNIDIFKRNVLMHTHLLMTKMTLITIGGVKLMMNFCLTL